MIRLFLSILFIVSMSNLFSQEIATRCHLHVDSLFEFLKSTCEFNDDDYERFFLHSSEHEVSFDFLLNNETENGIAKCDSSEVSYSLILLKLKLAVLLSGVHNLNISSMKLLSCEEFFTDYVIEINKSINLTFRFDLRRKDMVKIIDIFTEGNRSIFDLTE